MAGIVVLARNEGIEPASQTIYRRIIGWVIVVGEYNVEMAVQLCSGQLSESVTGQSEADQVALGALNRVSVG